MIVCASIALVASAGALTVNMLGVDVFTEKEIFRDVESFKTYMQTECDELGGNGKDYGVIEDRDGNVICEYYYAPVLYQKVDIVVGPDGSVYIEVIEKTAYWNAWDTHDTLLGACYGALFADIAVCAIVYVIYAARPIKKK